MALNDTKIKALKPKSKPYKVFDGEGLFIYVTEKGLKKWRIKYYYGGKEKIYTIGEYPQVSLREARAKVLELKQMLRQGMNPVVEMKENAPENSITFKEIAVDWLEKQTAKWSPDYKQTIKYRLEHYIYGQIGSMNIKKITAPQVLAILRKLEEKGKNDITRRLLCIVSQVFRYGVACGVCGSDPCRDLNGALAFHKSTPRAAITDPKEVGQFMRNIMAYPLGTVRQAMLWNAYTFCRPGEVRRAEWAEIDFEKRLWIIPPEKMKMKREHRVPLPRQCFDILEEQKGLDDKYIFPSVRKGRCLSDNGMLVAIRSMGYEKDKMCAHGFRAMASTLLNELGYRPDIIEISLAHGDINKVRAAYNRAEYMEERRKMLQEYADYLDSLAKKDVENIS